MLLIVVIVIIVIALIPEIEWQETVVIAAILVAGLYVLSYMMGVRIFNILINNVVGMFKGIVNK